MIASKHPLRRAAARMAAGRLVVLAALLAAGACVSGKQSVEGSAALSDPEPGHATYSCGDLGNLDVDNMRTSVRLTDPDGDNVELPASPADQTSRYGQSPYALLLEGREALYMKDGREPVTCMR